MNVTYDFDSSTVVVAVTSYAGRYKWNADNTYAVAHDPIRQRVAGVMVRQEAGRGVYLTQKERAVEISVRRSPYEESVRLDRHITIDLCADGSVRMITVEE